MCFIRYFLRVCLQIALVQAAPSWTPQWSNNYHVKGVLSVPQAGVLEPFEAWYSKDLGKSRVDFYNGMVQTYQYSDLNYGLNFKLFPYTDEKHFNIRECFMTPGTANNHIDLQSVLYPLDGVFEYKGQMQRDGYLVQQWTHTERFPYAPNIEMSLTFYVKCESVPFGRAKCAPVHLEMIGGNAIFPSHVGNYYIDYELYEPDNISESIFNFKFSYCHDVAKLNAVRPFIFSSLNEFLPNVNNLVSDKLAAKYASKLHKKRKPNLKSLVDFKRNRDYVRQHNKGNSTYKLAFNNFIALNTAQFAAYNKRIRPGYFPLIKRLSGSKKQIKLLKSSISVPVFQYNRNDLALLSRHSYYNLHQKGAMNPVQSQLNCGSCWAFATAATLEGLYFMKYYQRIKLSEQALIDCSWGFKNLGCDGGSEKFSLDWIVKHEGLPISKDYGSYKANNGYCAKGNHSEIVRVRGYEIIAPGDHKAVQIALLKNGPVLTAMHASIKSVGLYSRGVYNDVECQSASRFLDHAVVIVGYDYQDGKLYWVVRNSWSSAWGINGHMYVAADNNICGLTTEALVVYIE